MEPEMDNKTLWTSMGLKAFY